MKTIGGIKPITFSFLEKDMLVINYYNERVLKRIQDKIKNNINPNMYKKTYVRASMTNFSFFNEDDDFHHLLNDISFLLFKFADQNGFEGANKFKIIDAWGNILNKNEYVKNHHHMNNKNIVRAIHISANLFFNKREPGTYFSRYRKQIKPERGKIIVFLANEMHLVDVYKQKEPRYTLAFNLQCRKVNND
jgi:hypothetical protein